MTLITQHYGKILAFGAGLLLMFLLMRSCGGRQQLADYRAEKARADSLSAKVKRDSIDHLKEQQHYQNQVIAARAQTAAAKTDVQAINQKLTASTSKINQLTKDIAYYKSLPIDSSFVKVHPAYIENCDSLSVAATIQQGEINEAREEIRQAAELLNYEIALRDTMIEKEQKYIADLRAQFNAQAAVLKSALKQAKPRGRFLAGAGLIGNKEQILSGAKVAMAYQTRGGKQFQGGAVVMNKQVYYEGTVLITLFK